MTECTLLALVSGLAAVVGTVHLPDDTFLCCCWISDGCVLPAHSRMVISVLCCPLFSSDHAQVPRDANFCFQGHGEDNWYRLEERLGPVWDACAIPCALTRCHFHSKMLPMHHQP